MQKLKYSVASALPLVFILTACGGAQDSEKLPNQRVPLHVTAHEATLLGVETSAESPAIAVPAAKVPTQGESPSPSTDAQPVVIVATSRTLLQQALRLAQLSEKTYLSFQQKWIGSKEAACNFFLITSLCESGYCKNDKPFYRAADFDTYFRETGWAEITLSEAKNFLQNNSEIDLVAQRGSSTPSGMGHVAVPFRVSSQNDLIVAQGNYHESSHEVENWDDRFAQSFHYFVNFSPKVSRAFLK